MSDSADQRKRVIILIVLLLAVGGVLAWNFTRNPQAVTDDTARKVDDLKAILDDAMAEQRQQPEPPPPQPTQGGPMDMRSGGSSGG